MQFEFRLEGRPVNHNLSISDGLILLDSLHAEWKRNGSTEGLTNFALATVDVFGRMANNLKTLVFRSFRSLKRSELRAFSESNMARVAALEKLHYGMLNTTKVYIPNHMVVTYPAAVTMLQDAYRTANAVNVLTAAIRELGVLQTALLRGSLSVEQVTGELNTDRETQIREATAEMLKRLQGIELLMGEDPIQRADELTTSIFSMVKPAENGSTVVIDTTGNEVEMADFSKMFRSMEEFRLLRKNLLDLEEQLLNVNKVERLTQEMDTLAKNIQRTISSGNRVPPAEIVEALARYVRRIAVCISYQGYANAAQMVLEHNLCLSYSALFNRI